MKRTLAVLLLLAIAPAAAKMGWSEDDGGVNDFAELHWHGDANHTELAWNASVDDSHEYRILLMSGTPGEAEPLDWILIHVGKHPAAYDADGPVELGLDAASLGTGNMTAIHLRAMPGACLVAVGEVVVWDYGYLIVDAIPDGSTMHWNAGDVCDGAVDMTPTPAAKAKKSPLPLAVTVAALALTRRLRH